MLAAVAKAKEAGAKILVGGDRLSSPGFYMAPTLLENVAPHSEISQCEIWSYCYALSRPRF